MLKTLGATLAIALFAGQAFALNPQPLPPMKVHFTHVMPRCPPAKGYARTCV